MKKIFIIFVTLLISALIIYKGAQVRKISYDLIPSPILDEFNYIWQGLSIKKYGLPIGWVTFTEVYKNQTSGFRETKLEGLGIKKDDNVIDVFKFRKDPKPLIAIEELDWGEGKKQLFFGSPFFDHSPISGLIYSLGIEENVHDFSQVKPGMFRKISLQLALLSSILLFILILVVTKEIWIAVLSIIIYSTVPTYILATRTAFLENTAIPFVLGHLILLILGLQRSNKKLTGLIFFISGLLGGLAALAKEPAFGFLLGSSILFYIHRIPFRHFIIFVLGAILPIIIYIIWGLWIHPSIFLNIFLANSTRGFYGSLKLISMFVSLRFKNFPEDGWWAWGIISFLLVSLKINKQYLNLVLPFLGHFLLVIYLSSPNYPWYYLTMIPFFASFSAITIWEIYKKPNPAIAAAFLLIPLSSSLYWGYIVNHPQFSIESFRILSLIFVLFVFLRIRFAENKSIETLWNIFFILLIFQTVRWNYQSLYFILEHWGKLPISSLPNL